MIANFERASDHFGLAKMQNIVAGIHFVASQFERSIEVAEEAISLIETLEMPYWASTTGATLAEAYFDIGNLKKA